MREIVENNFINLDNLGLPHPPVETSDVPAGWTSVPVELDSDGHIINAAMVAGSVGMQISSSGKALHIGKGEIGVDTVQPLSGWWMYETSKYSSQPWFLKLNVQSWLTCHVETEDEILEEKRVIYEERRKMHSFYPEWKGKESLGWLGEY